MMKKYMNMKIVLIGLILVTGVLAQEPYRYGTTAANFLEIGNGPAVAMGEAYVSVGQDISSIYWNPAGLAFQKQTELYVMNQPWVAGIANRYFATAIPIPRIGNLGFSLNYVDYGNIEVTDMEFQEGTGEYYSATESAFALTFARSITNWFSFGTSAKYISSKIWHSSASAYAVDLGVSIITEFFSPTDRQEDGLRIGMSISNYGTRMTYEGIDLLSAIDVLPDENGNFEFVQGTFKMEGWDLPVIFRTGISFYPFMTHNHNLLVAVDVLQPNNNSQSINLGMQYDMAFIRNTHFFVRGGLKGIHIVNSEETFSLLGMDLPYASATFGVGVQYSLLGRQSVNIDYGYKSMGILGYVDSFTLTYRF